MRKEHLQQPFLDIILNPTEEGVPGTPRHKT